MVPQVQTIHSYFPDTTMLNNVTNFETSHGEAAYCAAKMTEDRFPAPENITVTVHTFMLKLEALRENEDTELGTRE